MIVELVLQSGSLKDVAQSYGVSYPTIRLRLDRLIDRLKLAVKGKSPDPLSALLARLVERGELSASNARAVREMTRRMASKSHSTAHEEIEPLRKGGVHDSLVDKTNR